jgi:hypothetical protein
VLRNIWNDPVWSKVIAAAIIAGSAWLSYYLRTLPSAASRWLFILPIVFVVVLAASWIWIARTRPILHEVRFDYLPDPPVGNGWVKVSDGDENPTFSRDPEMPGSLRMHTNGKVFAMDYRIPGSGRKASSVQFFGEFRSGAIFYVEVEVVNKLTGPGVENWWFAHVFGDSNRIPEKCHGREWKFFIAPDRGGQYPRFDINLKREAQRVLDNGKLFHGITRLRVRGDIVLSPIKLMRGKAIAVS